jgi:hypothetical protein
MVEEINDKLSATEQAFGDFRAGRYAWLLKDVRPLIEPIPPLPGRQSILEMPLQDESASLLQRWVLQRPERVARNRKTARITGKMGEISCRGCMRVRLQETPSRLSFLLPSVNSS